MLLKSSMNQHVDFLLSVQLSHNHYNCPKTDSSHCHCAATLQMSLSGSERVVSSSTRTCADRKVLVDTVRAPVATAHTTAVVAFAKTQLMLVSSVQVALLAVIVVVVVVSSGQKGFESTERRNSLRVLSDNELSIMNPSEFLRLSSTCLSMLLTHNVCASSLRIKHTHTHTHRKQARRRESRQ